MSAPVYVLPGDPLPEIVLDIITAAVEADSLIPLPQIECEGGPLDGEMRKVAHPACYGVVCKRLTDNTLVTGPMPPGQRASFEPRLMPLGYYRLDEQANVYRWQPWNLAPVRE